MSEAFLRAFHAAHAGELSRALASGGSYDRLAALVPRDARVLDLACGDGAVLARLGPRAAGIDLSREELAVAPPELCGRIAQARAHALPIADGAIDACTCHLAFMLFDEPERVVAELERVLVPGGDFIAVLGGGPVADDREPDAFHHFAALVGGAPRLGDSRARSEVGWRALFAGWRVAPFERWEIDLGGPFERAWQFLATSYELAPGAAARVRAALFERTGAHVRCRLAVFLARARRS